MKSSMEWSHESIIIRELLLRTACIVIGMHALTMVYGDSLDIKKKKNMILNEKQRQKKMLETISEKATWDEK